MGTGLPFSFSSSERFNAFNIGISPFARYYFNTNKVSPFVEGKVGFSHVASTYKETVGTPSKNSNQYLTGGLGVGIAYFITPTIGLEAILSYDILRLDLNNKNSLNLNAGFQIYLPARQKK